MNFYYSHRKTTLGKSLPNSEHGFEIITPEFNGQSSTRLGKIKLLKSASLTVDSCI